jgi:hypothetical protein
MKQLEWAALGALILAGAQASASVDTSAPPGGVYRLKPGIYVAEGSNCAAPANAAILQYDGKGLGGAHTRACKVTVRSRTGNRAVSKYIVDESCIGAGAGPAPRTVQRQQVTVRDALHFTQTIKGRATSYAYCPVDQLPQELRTLKRP